jgi:hypothetical protein
MVQQVVQVPVPVVSISSLSKAFQKNQKALTLAKNAILEVQVKQKMWSS